VIFEPAVAAVAEQHVGLGGVAALRTAEPLVAVQLDATVPTESAERCVVVQGQLGGAATHVQGAAAGRQGPER